MSIETATAERPETSTRRPMEEADIVACDGTPRVQAGREFLLRRERPDRPAKNNPMHPNQFIRNPDESGRNP